MAKQATSTHGELVEAKMALTTRRQFVRQTALAAAALYGHPIKTLAGTRIFGAPRTECGSARFADDPQA